MKVIEEKHLNISVCDCCGSKLEYSYSDVHKDSAGWRLITCPICSSEIIV